MMRQCGLMSRFQSSKIARTASQTAYPYSSNLVGFQNKDREEVANFSPNFSIIFVRLAAIFSPSNPANFQILQVFTFPPETWLFDSTEKHGVDGRYEDFRSNWESHSAHRRKILRSSEARSSALA